jgi:hypothetical protein
LNVGVELNWDVDFRWATDFSSGRGSDGSSEYLDGIWLEQILGFFSPREYLTKGCKEYLGWSEDYEILTYGKL